MCGLPFFNEITITEVDIDTFYALVIEIPRHVTRVRFNVPHMRRAPKLPDWIEAICFKGCIRLLSIPDALPTSLKSLKFDDCWYLRSIHSFPASLTRLKMVCCQRIASLPPLPRGMIKLWLAQCDGLTSIPKLPTRLLSLTLMFCGRLKTIPALPWMLLSLECMSMYSLLRLPDRLPLTMRSLVIQSCPYLERVSKLPPRLRIFILGRCDNLLAIPDLPDSLFVLEVRNCRLIAKLPTLSISMHTLVATYCRGLITLSAFPPNFKVLMCVGTSVSTNALRLALATSSTRLDLNRISFHTSISTFYAEHHHDLTCGCESHYRSVRCLDGDRERFVAHCALNRLHLTGAMPKGFSADLDRRILDFVGEKINSKSKPRGHTNTYYVSYNHFGDLRRFD